MVCQVYTVFRSVVHLTSQFSIIVKGCRKVRVLGKIKKFEAKSNPNMKSKAFTNCLLFLLASGQSEGNSHQNCSHPVELFVFSSQESA